MRIVAPLPSSTSLLQLSQTSTVFRATIRPPFHPMSQNQDEILRRFTRAAYSPRSQKADERLFLEIETGFPGTHDA
jgi:hypothetical protein